MTFLKVLCVTVLLWDMQREKEMSKYQLLLENFLQNVIMIIFQFWVLFVRLCGSRFPPVIIFLLPTGFPLAFLVVQICWGWIHPPLFMSEKVYFVFTFESFCESYFPQIEFQVNSFFSFSTLKMLNHCFRTCAVSEEKIAVILIFFFFLCM